MAKDEIWTLQTLKIHLESRIKAVEDNAKLALDAADKAAEKADLIFEKRMDNTNEWRDAMKDLIATFVTKGDLRWAIIAIIGAVGTLIGILNYIGGT